jgi:hypothetical protein
MQSRAEMDCIVAIPFYYQRVERNSSDEPRAFHDTKAWSVWEIPAFSLFEKNPVLKRSFNDNLTYSSHVHP